MVADNAFIQFQFFYLLITRCLKVGRVELWKQPRLVGVHRCVRGDADEVLVFVDEASSIHFRFVVYDITEDAPLVRVVVLLGSLQLVILVAGYDWECHNLAV